MWICTRRAFRVGHKGAAALEPENTLRSLQRAVELGCDLIEFDVLDLHDGTLVLAHSDDLLEVSHGAAAGRVRDADPRLAARGRARASDLRRGAGAARRDPGSASTSI